MLTDCKRLKIGLLLLLSVAMFILMFPVATGGDPWPIEKWSCLLTWIFLVPLWITLRHQSKKHIMVVGWLFCFFSTIGSLYWFFIAMKKYGEMPAWESTLILISAGLLVGTIRWFAFFITSRFQSIKCFPLFAALVFTLTEWAQQYIPFQGFPWITPGYGVLPMHHLVQSVDLIGMTGINFLIFMTNFLIIEWFVQLQQGLRPSKRPLMAIVIILSMSCLYGVNQCQRFGNAFSEGDILKISLLQGNIAQDIKWDAKEREEIIKTYQDLSVSASLSKPDLIVWPEASLPQTLHIDRQEISVLPKEVTQGTFVIGAPTWFKENGLTRFQNSAFTTTPDGKILHRYDKVRLVPFGEYIPSFGGLPIKKIVPAMAGDFSQGSLNQQISEVNGHPFGLFICFEVLFPDIARSWVNQGAEFFVNITNDAWFDRSSGPYQHLRFAAMRTIEFRKPLVRAANTGVTTWFDAAGEQHEALQLFQRGFITANIYPNKVRTVYARYPNVIPAILWIATLCILIMHRKKAT
jgi:apolipoprotein N-acyltransferase